MLNVGDIVLAKVTGISDFGFFVSIGNFKGLCHISEISNNFVEDIKKFVSVGDEIYVLILDIDDESKKVKVSIKDIYYLSHDDENRIKETRRGFLPLKEMLPIWIKEKMMEYENKEKGC
ncbi:MAG: S1 RNA-binding domain-containing protein [Bacilli bacterium]